MKQRMREPVSPSPFAAERQLAGKTILVVCAVTLVVATLVARGKPATGYEVSIYSATPALFWIGTGVTLAGSFVVALGCRSRYIRWTALLLSGLAFVTIVGLPLIRGYTFHGTADSLSHLGWVRDVLAGRLWLPSLLYPSLHGTAAFTKVLTGASFTRTLLLVPLIYVVLFAIGVPLAVRAITDDWMAVVIGAFSGFMILPINNISAHMTAHPSTMGVLFTPFLLAVIVFYLRGPPVAERRVTGMGLLLGLCSLGIIFIHPQQALNHVLLLGAIAVVQFRRRIAGSVLTRRAFAHAVFLSSVVMAWSFSHQRVAEAASGLLGSLLSGSGTNAVAQRGASLTAIGASLEELFVKLFLVSAVYVALTGLVMLASVSGRFGNEIDNHVVTALTLGLIPVGGVFLLYLAAGIDTMYFRYLAFIMSVVTVLGALGLRYLIVPGFRDVHTGERTGITGSRFRCVAVVFLVAVSLSLSVPVIYQSPYMYKANMHTTEQQFAGYEATYEYAGQDVLVYGVREGPDRFSDAIFGTGELDSGSFRESTGVSSEAFDRGLTETYDDPIYLAVDDHDRGREGIAFRNLRYSEGTLRAIGDERNVNRVMSNGAFELYLVK